MKSKVEIEKKISELIEEVSLGAINRSVATAEKEILKDLMLDSLDYASVMLSCEKWLGIKLNEDKVDWTKIRTVGLLSELMFQAQENE